MNFEYEFSLSFVGNLFKRYSAIVQGLGAKIRGGIEVDEGLGDSEETGMWILAIRRGDKCIRPKPETKIQVDDVLIASGYAKGEEDLKKLASP